MNSDLANHKEHLEVPRMKTLVLASMLLSTLVGSAKLVRNECLERTRSTSLLKVAKKYASCDNYPHIAHTLLKCLCEIQSLGCKLCVFSDTQSESRNTLLMTFHAFSLRHLQT